MGWSFGFHASRKSLVDSIIDEVIDNDKYHSKAIKHAVRWESDYYVLWFVLEVTVKFDTEFYGTRKAGEKMRLIECFLLAEEEPNGFWGSNPSSESAGPLYYSCPLSYLKLANAGIDNDWRDKVRQYHQSKSKKFAQS